VYCTEEAQKLLEVMMRGSTAPRSDLEVAVTAFLTCVAQMSRFDTSFRQLVAELVAQDLMARGLDPVTLLIGLVEEKVSKLRQLGLHGSVDPYERSAAELVLSENFTVDEVVESIFRIVTESKPEEIPEPLRDLKRFAHNKSELRLRIQLMIAEPLARALAALARAQAARLETATATGDVLARTIAMFLRAVRGVRGGRPRRRRQVA